MKVFKFYCGEIYYAYAAQTKEQAIEKLFTTVEDFSNGYIYDNEAETIYHEVDGKVVAEKGDESVRAGDNYFEIESEN